MTPTASSEEVEIESDFGVGIVQDASDEAETALSHTSGLPCLHPPCHSLQPFLSSYVTVFLTNRRLNSNLVKIISPDR